MKDIKLLGHQSLVVISLLVTVIYAHPNIEVQDNHTPGLMVEPRGRKSSIKFHKDDISSSKSFVDEIKSLLRDFEGRYEKLECEIESPIAKDATCSVDSSIFHPCSEENEFGYEMGKPCFFLKLNQIFAWTPEFYNNITDLPPEMPSSLVHHIRDREWKNKTLDVVWMSCGGKSSADVKNIDGWVNYRSLDHEQGFVGRIAKLKKMDAFSPSLVAVQFPQVKLGVDIEVQCKIWAKNLDEMGNNSRDVVEFTLRIDEKEKDPNEP